MKIDIQPGQDITHAIQDAISAARNYAAPVSFDFNGQTVIVQADSDPVGVLALWDRDMKASTQEFAESQAFVEKETRDAQAQRLAQERLNVHLRKMEGALAAGLPTALHWLELFIRRADYGGLVIPCLYVGWSLSKFAPANTNVGRTDLKRPGNEGEAARWVIGQAVASLERNHTPHPVLADRAADLQRFL